LEWFSRAVPVPTQENLATQVACHFEEVAEMAEEVGNCWVADHLDQYSYEMKTDKPTLHLDPTKTLDALCDQIVTAIGVAYMAGWDIAGALAEVDRANWSKFVDGSPAFDEHGKIKKGENYNPPNLNSFV